MLEVVFGHSAKESLRIARVRDKSALFGGGVLGLCFSLSMGDIASPPDSIMRRDVLYNALTANTLREPEDARSTAEEHWKSYLCDLETLKQCAKAGEAVRIWYDNTPDSVCGLHFTAAQLAETTCPVSAVCLPMWLDNKDNSAVHFRSWDEMGPADFSRFMDFEREVAPPILRAYAMRWAQLQRENAALRAVVNGHLQSVTERFYDDFILRTIPEGSMTKGRLIGFVLGRHGLGVCDWLISRRIDALVEEGTLQSVEEGPLPYDTTLRRNGSV